MQEVLFVFICHNMIYMYHLTMVPTGKHYITHLIMIGSVDHKIMVMNIIIKKGVSMSLNLQILS